MIRLGQLGLGALSLPGLLGAEKTQAIFSNQRQHRNKAKSCIFLFLWGGPPQQDMWDMKPDVPAGIRSIFQPIRTVVPGKAESDADFAAKFSAADGFSQLRVRDFLLAAARSGAGQRDDSAPYRSRRRHLCRNLWWIFGAAL
jgi:hypothetical protein